MGYSNPEFQVRHQVLVSGSHSLSTATASATDGANRTNPSPLPNFLRKTQVNKVSFLCRVIPNAASTALQAIVKNGTSTMAVVTLTTATAGQVLTGVVTAANAVFAADSGPTIDVVGTATASAAANGTYDVIFETQEEFA